ncbi:hypothetical protein BTR23_24030 [Alkalihalophilus pseudofirmus]|nr:hypothetical protein BTR23_24030 [Alkalihalophilus pseudofirmus]
MHFKRFIRPLIKRKLMWKLTLINSIVIGIVIWLVGISVKDYACYLIEKENTLTIEQRHTFIERMDSYLMYAVVLSIIIAAIIHFFFITRLLEPLHDLTNATKQIKEGKYPNLTEKISEDEIGQLTEHFNEMVNHIKKVEMYREKMTRDIAHELRTPLTNINGYLEALRNGVLNGNEELYDSLYEESLRLTDLVEQLRQIDVWKQHQLLSEGYETFSIRDLLVNACNQFKIELQKANIEVDLQVEEAILVANKSGIKQAIFNLIENVLRYDQGKWMAVSGKIVGTDYKVEITNHGLPIPIESLDQPFERFYRADASRNRNSGGSGLGLAIMKEIIESHNGSVGFLTQENVHIFWFSIPLKNSSN